MPGSAKTLTHAFEGFWNRMTTIERYSKLPIRPMTMKRLLQTNSAADSAVIKNAEWVRQELSVRLAHRLFDFHRLPFVALGNPYVRETYEVYVQTFERLIQVPPITKKEDELAFSELMANERQQHDRTVDIMGQGVKQLRTVAPDVKLDGFLERFFLFRISRRIMIDHMLALHHPRPGWTGCIHLECKPADIIRSRAEDVQESCRHTYGIAPRVVVGGNVSTEFAFIPDHLALIVTELLKNAMRATVEFYTLGNSMMPAGPGLITDESQLPEVRVEVYKGKHDVVIKFSDKGGGIPPKKLEHIWAYGYSTVEESNYKMGQHQPNIAANFVRADMAGYGFGLPLGRAFARYFGGDIHIQSFFGLGTDVYLTLNHIGDQEEALAVESLISHSHSHSQTTAPSATVHSATVAAAGAHGHAGTPLSLSHPGALGGPKHTQASLFERALHSEMAHGQRH